MIVTRLADIIGTDRDVRGPVWASRRFLLAEDGAGFSLTETTVEAGAEQVIWYKHHVEANYVIEGTGEVHPLAPGTMYALDRHERHRLTTFTRMRIVCVFLPPLTGRETHDADGAYTPPE